MYRRIVIIVFIVVTTDVIILKLKIMVHIACNETIKSTKEHKYCFKPSDLTSYHITAASDISRKNRYGNLHSKK